MTHTPTNWPNPERPGVPMFPERKGLHVLVTPYGRYCLMAWEPKENIYKSILLGERIADIVKNYTYYGAVLTPTQIAEMLAGERERCAKVCEDAYEKSGRDFEYLGCNDAASQIRNLGDAQ